ncbi:histidinol-phosphate transaminase [Coriobacteriia bacterium Es71-Z0120]|uniref:histidinol-phosphate transaminase n=1 Tax=Parvivirga hydrogeniphila TaxID=2939460 RepID=UPI002260DA28|nr:histidinol-phosphate transaminase [Parvivirga hydrogeniphila]MCL4078724.1 histidinol-phosphate transaminase [Parvivirga hydrogeniphila]
MDRVRPPREALRDLSPYDAKHLEAEVMLASNENPLNLPGELLERLSDLAQRIPYNRYPDPMATGLREEIAAANGLEPSNVLVGNGGDEIIQDLVLAWGGPGRVVLDFPPTFVMYSIDAKATGSTLVQIPRRPDFSIDEEALKARLADGDVDLIFIANPNNPTGTLAPETLLIDVLNATDALVVVDEAYFEFSRHTMRPHMSRHANLAILRTFSKAFSLAGLRAGYLLAHEDVITELTKVRQPYSVNRFTQAAARLVFRERPVFEAAISQLLRNRDVLVHGLSEIPGVEVFPSEANFVLFRVEHASAVWRDLLKEHSVLVRDFSRTPGLEECLRVSVGTEDEVRRFLAAMEEIMTRRRAAAHFGVAGAHAGSEGE